MVAAMKTFPPSKPVHPQGESLSQAFSISSSPIPVDTYGDRVHVEWDPQATVTPLGQLPFFIEFLKTADLFAPWVLGLSGSYRKQGSSPMRYKCDQLQNYNRWTVYGPHQRNVRIDCSPRAL